jgi:alpha-L-rhamnosidase
LIAKPLSEITTTAFGTLKLSDLADNLVLTARKNLFDAELCVFVSGESKQVSWASNAWAIIAGLHEGEEHGARILKAAYNYDKAVKAVTPYLHHYVGIFSLDSDRRLIFLSTACNRLH